MGVLQLNCRQPGRFTKEAIESYEELANRIAEALSGVKGEQPA